MVCCVAKTPRQAGARCVADHRPAKDVLAEKAREREEAARQKNKKEEEADRRIHQAAVAAAAAAAHVKEAEGGVEKHETFMTSMERRREKRKPSGRDGRRRGGRG